MVFSPQRLIHLINILVALVGRKKWATGKVERAGVG